MARPDLERHTQRLSADIVALALLIDHGLTRLLNAVQAQDPFDARMVRHQLQSCVPAVAAIEEQIIDVFTLQQPIVASDLRLIVGALEVCYHLRDCGWYTLQQAVLLDTQVRTCAPTVAAIVQEKGVATRSLLQAATTAFVHADGHLASSLLPASDGCAAIGDEDFATSYHLTVSSGACTCDGFLRHLAQVGDHARAIARCALRLEYAT